MEFVVSMFEMRGSSAFVLGVLFECCGTPIEKQRVECGSVNWVC